MICRIHPKIYKIKIPGSLKQKTLNNLHSSYLFSDLEETKFNLLPYDALYNKNDAIIYLLSERVQHEMFGNMKSVYNRYPFCVHIQSYTVPFCVYIQSYTVDSKAEGNFAIKSINGKVRKEAVHFKYHYSRCLTDTTFFFAIGSVFFGKSAFLIGSIRWIWNCLLFMLPILLLVLPIYQVAIHQWYTYFRDGQYEEQDIAIDVPISQVL